MTVLRTVLAASLLAVEPHGDVLVDFAEVVFCDSAGLQALIVAWRRHDGA